MNLRTKNKINLDPRTKVLLLFLGNVLMFSIGKAIYLHITTILAIVLTIVLGKLKPALKMLCFYISAYGITYLINFLPETISSIWGMIILPFVIFMPLYAIAFMLFTTTQVNEVITALQKLKIPAAIITPLIVMFRFFPTLKQELFAIRDAMKLKGVRKNPIKLVEHVYVPLLFNCVKIGEDLNISGLTRGLGLNKSTTQTVKIKFGIFDLIVILIMSLLIVLRKMGV